MSVRWVGGHWQWLAKTRDGVVRPDAGLHVSQMMTVSLQELAVTRTDSESEGPVAPAD